MPGESSRPASATRAPHRSCVTDAPPISDAVGDASWATAGAKPRRPVDQFEDRRRELAAAALQTLGELGYARTSLREIA
jgi:AcrR family transcriptional regulator